MRPNIFTADHNSNVLINHCPDNQWALGQVETITGIAMVFICMCMQFSIFTSHWDPSVQCLFSIMDRHGRAVWRHSRWPLGNVGARTERQFTLDVPTPILRARQMAKLLHLVSSCSRHHPYPL